MSKERENVTRFKDKDSKFVVDPASSDKLRWFFNIKKYRNSKTIHSNNIFDTYFLSNSVDR